MSVLCFHIYLSNPRCSGANTNKKSLELNPGSLASPSTYWRDRTFRCRTCLSEHWFWCLTSWWAPLGHWAEALAFASRTLSPGNCANEKWQKKKHSSEEGSLVGANLLGSIFKDKCFSFLSCFLHLSTFQSSGQRLHARHEVCGGFSVVNEIRFALVSVQLLSQSGLKLKPISFDIRLISQCYLKLISLVGVCIGSVGQRQKLRWISHMGMWIFWMAALRWAICMKKQKYVS